MNMRMSAEGRKRLTAREGIRLKAYKDSVGVWTIGIGHTSAAGPPQVTPSLTITPGECDAIFARDLVKYETAVNKAATAPLEQHQFDALVSLCYNIGPGALAKSTVVRRLNMRDYRGAAEAFLMWNKPAEIIGRRKSERVQFLTPYNAPKAPPVILAPIKPDIPIAPPKAPAQPAPSGGFFNALGARLRAAFPKG